MHLRTVSAREWIETPEGSLGRHELRALVQRLDRIPRETERVRIEWDRVTHVDFRGLAPLASRMQALRDRGLEIRCTGLSPYLLAILRFALSLDDYEMFERPEGNEARAVPMFRVSEN